MIRIAPLNPPPGRPSAGARSGLIVAAISVVCGLAGAMPALSKQIPPPQEDNPAPEPTTARVVPASVLVTKLKALQPELPIESVQETALQGVLAVELEDGNVIYGTADGRFLFTGDMYGVESEGFVNLTDVIRAKRRRALLADLREEDAIVFSPVGGRRAYVNVFTDVDCGYCRKLHREMAEINALGIEVRYLAFPRAGKDSDSYRKIVSAWCARDPRRAITELKRGQSIPRRTCPNPVAVHMELANQLGVTGTPALLTEDGRLIPGYLPAASLAEALGL